MKIEGRKIALEIEKSLHINTVPTLAVILIGKDASSLNYVSQKLKVGIKTGIKVKLFRYDLNINIKTLEKFVISLNQDKKIHGIIIQRPVPLAVSSKRLNIMVSPNKDIDGFHPRSRFDPPVALAVTEILKSIRPFNFITWLKKQIILIIGRGETAGKPIAKYFIKKDFKVTVAHSQTINLKEMALSSNIIISCVGKSDIVRHDMVNSSTILIGVGLHLKDNKLKPDYREEDIASKVAFYTPVPGGVGPVNVIMLMKNVIKAAKLA